ncbi:MAG: hypothetical protein KBT46_00080 [Ruminococcus sp.]|nr:hypothetical protein [Candidatus Copronaster equi]
MSEKKTTENVELNAVTKFLKNVKFKKKFFGGVDERDVWKKIDELNNLYKTALIAERARYNALLKIKNSSSDGDGNV